MLASSFARALALSALAASLLGCSSSGSTSTALPHPTVVEVSPLEFASEPACDAGPGSLKRYIATLVDVTPTSATDSKPLDFKLPSSALQVEANGSIHYEPIPCRLSVSFGWVVAGHSYQTELLGYDRDDLELLEPGFPIAVDPASRAVVEPRWTAMCGAASEDDSSDGGSGNVPERAVRAESDLTRTVRYCGEWLESQQ
ncbi:MAG TPA: hypothetical protein VFQ35_25260 [Polyangiaceae bacterium]|nr:hypothetical protein [Polyangiaceae bacterium]